MAAVEEAPETLARVKADSTLMGVSIAPNLQAPMANRIQLAGEVSVLLEAVVAC